MAGSVETRIDHEGPITQIAWYCTSDASGDVSGNGSYKISGTLMQLQYIPETGCSDNWDLTITGANTITASGVDATKTLADVLQGNGANLSNSTNGGVADTLTYLRNTTITPVIANLGNAKSVTLILYVWREG